MDVSAILAQAKAKYKPTEVEKEFPLELDLGNLAGFDGGPIESRSAKALHALSRDNVQLMVNALFELPSRSEARATVVVLPEKVTRLPRAMKAPKGRMPTRWEEFAKIKGIRKRKRGQMEWDDEIKEWVPRYGYKSKKHREAEQEWAIELKEGGEHNADVVFSRRAVERKERIAKQKRNEERNKVRKAGGSLTGSSGVTRIKRGKKGGRSIDPNAHAELSQLGGQKLTTEQLRKSIAIQALSTASYGKFDSRVRNQRKSRLKSGKKAKMPVTGTEDVERAKLARIADRVSNKKRGKDAGLDMSRAVNMYQVAHDREKQRLNDETYKKRDEQRKMARNKQRR